MSRYLTVDMLIPEAHFTGMNELFALIFLGGDDEKETCKAPSVMVGEIPCLWLQPQMHCNTLGRLEFLVADWEQVENADVRDTLSSMVVFEALPDPESLPALAGATILKGTGLKEAYGAQGI